MHPLTHVTPPSMPHRHFTVLTCVCALLSFFPLLLSQWWHVHCMWAGVSLWFLCDLLMVGSDLLRAEERIKEFERQAEISKSCLDIKFKLAEIMKRLNENDLLLMEIRSRVMAIKRQCVGPLCIQRAGSLMSNSL